MFVSQMMTRQSIISVFQKQVNMTTYEELESFVREIADGCCDPVLETRAQILLEFKFEPFNGKMVDEVIAEAYRSQRNDEGSDLSADMEALKLKYGDQPLFYMIDAIRTLKFDDGLDLAISWTGHVRHNETLEIRRLLLEELLLKEESPGTAYSILVGLMNMKNLKSLQVIENYHNQDKHGKVMFNLSQQVIDYLKKDS